MKTISEPEVRQILGTGFMLLLDHEYILPTEEQFLELADSWMINLETVIRPMIAKKRSEGTLHKEPDCENFCIWFLAWAQMEGYAVGMGIIKGHAMIVWIDDKKQRRWFEPQTGEIIKSQPLRLKVTVMP